MKNPEQEDNILTDDEIDDPETFPTKIAVFEWLQDKGEYLIGRSQFYQHCKDRLLIPSSGGIYTLDDVISYAQMNLKRSDSGEVETNREKVMRKEKMEVSLQKERVLLEKERFDLARKKGLYIPRDEHEQAVVARAVAFMAHLNHSFQAAAGDLIDAVEGNQQRAPELVSALSRMAEQRMSDFAADAEFDVVLEANE